MLSRGGGGPFVWFHTHPHIRVPLSFTLMDTDTLSLLRALAYETADPWSTVSSLGPVAVERFCPTTVQDKRAYYCNVNVLRIHYHASHHVLMHYVHCDRIVAPLFVELGDFFCYAAPASLCEWMLHNVSYLPFQAIAFTLLCKLQAVARGQRAWKTDEHIHPLALSECRPLTNKRWKHWQAALDTHAAIVSFVERLERDYVCVPMHVRATHSRKKAAFCITTAGDLVQRMEADATPFLVEPKNVFARTFAFIMLLERVAPGQERVHGTTLLFFAKDAPVTPEEEKDSNKRIKL